MKKNSISGTDALQQEHLTAELPVAGTSLNPLESGWVFAPHASAAPPEKLDQAMQQGE